MSHNKLDALSHSAEMTEERAQAVDGLLKAARAPRKQVELSTFKHYAGIIVKHIQGEPVNIFPWIDFVGGHYASAEIVDNGKVVAFVPSILRTIPTYRMKDNVESLNSVSERVDNMRAINPRAASKILENGINQNYVHTPIDPEVKKQWMELLSFCGVEQPEMPAGDITNVSTETIKGEDLDMDDEEYDEL